MNISTVEQLSDALSSDLIWRKRELTALRFLAEKSSIGSDESRALLRALVALLYAHWEGFIRSAAESYLEYVHFQRLKYSELSVPFIAVAARRRVHEAVEARSIHRHIDLVSFLIRDLGSTAQIPYKKGVSTRSNLSSEVLQDILASIGVDAATFATKRVLIDETVVGERNKVAHGQYVRVNLKEYIKTHDAVLEMLEAVRTAVDSGAALGSFKVTSP